jgi:hypothetical protein
MNDAALFERVEAYKAKMEAEVVAKNEKLQASGFKRYLEDAGLI